MCIYKFIFIFANGVRYKALTQTLKWTHTLFLFLVALQRLYYFILWIWLADFDMSGLHSARHWSFLFLLSHAILVTSVICKLPQERLCLEQILEEVCEELTKIAQGLLAFTLIILGSLFRAFRERKSLQRAPALTVPTHD